MTSKNQPGCPYRGHYLSVECAKRTVCHSSHLLLYSSEFSDHWNDAGRDDSPRDHALVRLHPGDQQFPQEWNLLTPPVRFVDSWGTPSLSSRRVAIVGSRRSTTVGERIAHKMGRELTAKGWTVVSGLARGIDGAALEGALRAALEDPNAPPPVAILGNGLPDIYPPEHEDLASRIVQSGGVLYSEFDRKAPPRRSHFPKRNRLISALSRGVVVVEATLRSGSLITANWALEQGREVFAVPGSPEGPGSAGCHQLIREGALLVTSAEEVLGGLFEETVCSSKVPERLRAAFLAGERDLSRLFEMTQIPPARLLQYWETLLSDSQESDIRPESDENRSVS